MMDPAVAALYSTRTRLVSGTKHTDMLNPVVELARFSEPVVVYVIPVL